MAVTDWQQAGFFEAQARALKKLNIDIFGNPAKE
jgi:hypothetical protein